MTIAKKILVRLLVFAAINLVGYVLINASNTTDPLGPGLLLFLVFVVVAFAWGILDGLRSGPVALVTWAVVSAGVGLVLELELALTDDTVTSSVGSVLSTMIFTLFLVGVPALAGVGLGALIAGMRTSRAEPAHV